jgi:predicted aldo/keto reductase-like oxidoreductase
MNKRNFIKLSLGGIAAGLLPGFVKASNNFKSADEILKTDNPVCRILGKTGIKLPIISSGTLPENNENLTKTIFQSGIKHFDSAYSYGRGKNDEAIGAMLKIFGRENYILSTKISLPADKDTGQYTSEATTDAFLEQLDTSLKRLGTDYVDLLYLHGPRNREAALNENMLNGLRKAKEAGKARFIAVSTHSNQAEVIDAAIESKFYEVVLVAYNFMQKDTLESSIAKAAKAGLGVVGMKTFAGGFLDKEKTKPVNRIAALKWLLNDENVHTVLVRFKNYEDLNDFIPLMKNFEMNDKEKSDLELASISKGIYCIGCNKCISQCPHNLYIPDIMRAYMYAYGYSETLNAYDVITKLKLKGNECDDCNFCAVRCSKGFNIKQKIKDIARIKDVPIEFLT